MVERDWVSWHEQYSAPDSPMSGRLAVVQAEIANALDAAPPGDIRVVSACAGDGRDLLTTLAHHARGPDVRARLVEADPALAAAATAAAPPTVEVRTGDAGCTDAYLGAVPAQLVLMCGVFGNICDTAVRRTIEHLPALCLPAARVVWTRHRRKPDLTPQIRRWFEDSQFEEIRFRTGPGATWSVGVHRYTGPPVALVAGVRLFTFEDGR